MTYQGHLVIDMDSHVREAWDSERIYPGYIDAAYRETYRRFADAAQVLRTRPGDVGWDKLLWPRRLRPLGLYEEFEAPRSAGEREPSPSDAGGELHRVASPRGPDRVEARLAPGRVDPWAVRARPAGDALAHRAAGSELQ